MVREKAQGVEMLGFYGDPIPHPMPEATYRCHQFDLSNITPAGYHYINDKPPTVCI